MKTKWLGMIVLSGSVLLFIIAAFIWRAFDPKINEKGNNEPNDKKKTIRFQLKSEPASLHPAYSVNAVTNYVSSNLYESLVKFANSNVRLEASLAESWDISDDGLVYSFNIRPNVLFHDGTKLTSDEVVQSFQTVRDSLNVKDGLTQKMMMLIETIESIDSNTVKIRLKRPYTPFLSFLGSGAIPIFSSLDMDKSAGFTDETSIPAGTGPFQLQEWAEGEYILLTKNENYWGERKAKLDEIDFRLDAYDTKVAYNKLKNGQLDIIDIDKNRELGSQFDYYQADLLVTNFIALNTQREPFSQLQARKSVAHAIDRLKMINLFFEGSASLTNSFIPSKITTTGIGEFYAYDKAIAKQAFNGRGTNIKILDISINNAAFHQMLQQMLREIGFEAEIVSNVGEQAVSEILSNGDYDMVLMHWVWSNPDPDYLSNMLSQDGMGFNVSRFYDADLNNLFQWGYEMKNGEERTRIYNQIQMKLKEQVVLIPMFDTSRTYAFSEKVKNFVVHPTGKILFWNMDIEE